MPAEHGWLIQLLLPTRDNQKQPIAGHHFAGVQAKLAEQFGGVTAYQRSPASGLWKGCDGAVDGDEVVMVEVQAEVLDREWWRAYRLDREFRQDTILMRAMRIETM